MNVLITGAAGGLGRAMAAECARRGYRLFLTGVNADGLRCLQTGLGRQFAATAAIKACALTNPESVDALLAVPDGRAIYIPGTPNRLYPASARSFRARGWRPSYTGAENARKGNG